MKHIHFIGICGVAMSAIAIALQKKGYSVTGSDRGFYPPVSDHLKHAGIDFYPGWHVDKMVALGNPDLVVVGNVAGSDNPEWNYVQEKNIPYKSYPEVIAEFFVKKNSIVCAGTYGKTTSSAILSWILKDNKLDPTYMFGGVPLNDMLSAELTDSNYSILEGDEYKSARWDNRPKFVHYSPTHLLLTSVVWDHADIYPTEASYIRAFTDLVRSMPKNGRIITSEKIGTSIANLSACQIVRYGKDAKNDYQYFDVQTTKHGIHFNIKHQSELFNLQSSTLGDYMADNMTGCFAMAHTLGLLPQHIIQSIASFKNIKRRLEKRFDDGNVVVFDDIAHSPQKAKGVLESLRKIYRGKIIAIFEPNTGQRKTAAEAGYTNAFQAADTIFIPRFTTVKIAADDADPPCDGAHLAEVIAKTHDDVRYISDDTKLIDTILKETKKDDCIVFLGSHGFRGMIEELVRRVKQSKAE